MNRKKSILISLTGITVVMLALLGLTYGYYITNIIGNTNSNSISIDTKDLKLVYDDGTQDLVFGAIEPGWTNSDNPKVFTVNNTGKSNIDEYAVGIDEVINTLNRTEDLVYTITCKSYKYDDYEDDGVDATESGVCRGDSGEFPKENSLILTNQIDSGYIHVYEMVISYKYLDDVNQSEDMGASIGGRIQIYTLPETIDITGTVTGYSEGDYVEISTPTKTSQIVDGKYKLIGVEPGNHTLSIKYLDENDVVQTRSSREISIKMGDESGISGDTITMNSTSGNVTININGSSTSLGTDITGVGEHTKLLKDVIITNAIKNSKSESQPVETWYYENTLTIPGSQINNFDENTLSITEDDYGISYYYRGNVIDNYVNYSGMCWRAVRILGNGAIKLVLNDENNLCDSENYTVDNSSSAFIDGRTDIAFTTVNTSSYADFDYNSSQISSILSTWVSDNVLDISKLENTLWCYDTSIRSEYLSAGFGLSGCADCMDYYYGNDVPSLKCNYDGLHNTKPTVLNNYIGLLTKDEVEFAGMKVEGVNTSNYLNSNATSTAWWLYTPNWYGYDNGMSMMYVVSANKIDIEQIQQGYSVRPAVTLKKDVSVTTKVNSSHLPGTYQNPYVIE